MIGDQDNRAFAGQKSARKSDFWNEDKIDHATGSRNGKYLESVIAIGLSKNMGMHFRLQHESSGYTKSDNQRVSQC
jgi:hypothetical protein